MNYIRHRNSRRQLIENSMACVQGVRQEAPVSSDVMYESPSVEAAAGEKQAVKTSGLNTQPGFEEGPKPSITPPDSKSIDSTDFFVS